MASQRYSVERNEKWSCFSSISNRFLFPFQEKKEYEAWRFKEYGPRRASVNQAVTMSFEDALAFAERNCGREHISGNLREIGFEQIEIDNFFS